MLHARVDRRVDRGPVQRDPVGVLGGRHEEQRLDAVERAAHAVAVVVAAEDGDGRVIERRRARRVAHEQPLLDAVVGEPACHPPAEAAGRSRDGDACPRHAAIMAGGGAPRPPPPAPPPGAPRPPPRPPPPPPPPPPRRRRGGRPPPPPARRR